jgi:hypothetical protein
VTTPVGNAGTAQAVGVVTNWGNDGIRHWMRDCCMGSAVATTVASYTPEMLVVSVVMVIIALPSQRR